MTTQFHSAGKRAIAFCVALMACGAAFMQGCSAPQRTFESPNLAVDALVSAMRADDQKQLEQILGPESRDLLSSGDAVADANGRAEFLKMYDEAHALKSVDGGDEMTIEVGATAWPCPIPLVKGDKGWTFDTAAGLDEMLTRRIGRNELDAIQVCLAITDAQREFAAADFDGDGWREYARTFRSDPGKKNGLFWPTNPGEPLSPLGELAASANAEGYSAKDGTGPHAYHGYYYRILTAQGPSAPGGAFDYIVQNHMIGGFGIVAWPAEYANSGLKTFIVSHHGVVYEKDLGNDTDRIARAMKTFDPGPGWQPSEVPAK